MFYAFIRSTVRRSGSVLAASLLAALPALGQAILWEYSGVETPEFFGFSVAAAGDVDQDGIGDLIAGGTSYANGGGVARVFSGANGKLLHQKVGIWPNGQVGHSVSGAGDIDQDGHADFIAGAPYEANYNGSAYVWSGATGAKLLEFHETVYSYFGRDVSDCGDVDGDGIPDVVVGAPFDSSPNTGSLSTHGTAQVFSGSTGLRLHEFTGLDNPPDPVFDDFGWVVAGAGDLNMDGHCDLVVGSLGYYVVTHSGNDGSLLDVLPTQDFSFIFGGIGDIASAGDATGDGVPDIIVGSKGDFVAGTAGAIYVYSGADSSLHFSAYGDDADDYFGAAVDGGQDVDGDGWPDVVATALPCNGSPVCDDRDPGYVRALSGLDGSIIVTIEATSSDADGYGSGVGLLGDVNGDGHSEIAVGIPYQPKGGYPLVGQVHVYSPVDPSFKSTVDALVLSFGGTQPLRLQPGSQWAGSLYLVLGSVTGIAPGIPVDGVVLPLTLDAYTLYTLGQPNVAPLAGSLGFLGIDGKANAAFSIPAGLGPEFTGLALHHAFALLGSGGEVAFTSNSVPLLLVQ